MQNFQISVSGEQIIGVSLFNNQGKLLVLYSYDETDFSEFNTLLSEAMKIVSENVLKGIFVEDFHFYADASIYLVNEFGDEEYLDIAKAAKLKASFNGVEIFVEENFGLDEKQILEFFKKEIEEFSNQVEAQNIEEEIYRQSDEQDWIYSRR